MSYGTSAGAADSPTYMPGHASGPFPWIHTAPKGIRLPPSYDIYSTELADHDIPHLPLAKASTPADIYSLSIDIL